MQFDRKNFSDIEPFLQKYHYPEEIEQLKKLDQPNQLKWLLSRIKMGDYGHNKITALKSYYWSVISEFPLHEYIRFFKKAIKANLETGNYSNIINHEKLKLSNEFFKSTDIEIYDDMLKSCFEPHQSSFPISVQLNWVLDKIEKKEISPNSAFFADHFWIASLRLHETERSVFVQRALKLQLISISNERYADYILEKIFLNLPEEKLNIECFQNSISNFSLEKIKRFLNKNLNPTSSVFIDLQKNNKFVIKLKDEEYEIPFLLRIGLCKESHFFETLFNGPFKENSLKKAELTHVDKRLWNLFIECWKQNPIKVNGWNDVVEIFELGHSFGIILRDCEDYFAYKIRNLEKPTFEQLENFAEFFHPYDSIKIKSAIGFHLRDYFRLLNRKKAISQFVTGIVSKAPSREERLKVILQQVVVIQLEIGRVDDILQFSSFKSDSVAYEKSIELIKSLPSLKKLDIHYPITKGTVNAISQCKYLEKLTIRDYSDMRDDDLQTLSLNLRYLRNFSLSLPSLFTNSDRNPIMTESGFKTMIQLLGNRLNSLRLEVHYKYDNVIADVSDCSFPNLSTLSLSCFEIKLSNIDRILNSSKLLEVLHLESRSFKDDYIENNTQFNNLKIFHFSFGGGDITINCQNEKLNSLIKKMPNLTRKEVYENKYYFEVYPNQNYASDY